MTTPRPPLEELEALRAGRDLAQHLLDTLLASIEIACELPRSVPPDKLMEEACLEATSRMVQMRKERDAALAAKEEEVEGLRRRLAADLQIDAVFAKSVCDLLGRTMQQGFSPNDVKELVVSLQAERDALAALIRQQQAVIDRLPKTKDGAPVMLGDNCFTEDITQPGRPIVGCGVIELGVSDFSNEKPTVIVRIENGDEFETWVDYLFSTRSAAERARGGEA